MGAAVTGLGVVGGFVSALLGDEVGLEVSINTTGAKVRSGGVVGATLTGAAVVGATELGVDVVGGIVVIGTAVVGDSVIGVERVGSKVAGVTVGAGELVDCAMINAGPTLQRIKAMHLAALLGNRTNILLILCRRR